MINNYELTKLKHIIVGGSSQETIINYINVLMENNKTPRQKENDKIKNTILSLMVDKRTYTTSEILILYMQHKLKDKLNWSGNELIEFAIKTLSFQRLNQLLRQLKNEGKIEKLDWGAHKVVFTKK